MTKKSIHRLLFAVCSALLIAGAVILYEFDSEPDDSLRKTEFKCVLDIDGEGNGDMLIAGYNYLLLKSFADSLDSTADISCSYGTGSYIDSLKNGSVDIVVLTYKDSLNIDSVLISHPIDDNTVWAMRCDKVGSMNEINDWIDAVENDEGHLDQRSLFVHRFDPQKAAASGRKFKHISPYDDIIKAHAKTLGWDWRLLAAVIFQESRFHIEAHSRRGAQGLMQMMPVTARKYGVDNLLDPEESVEAGTDFLARLEKMFSDKAANADELCKFTLAAYNAGEGRLMDCINYADVSGGDPSTWEGIVAAIPDMRDESIKQVDTVKLGTFQGHETIAYIDNVLALYNAFCTLCPK